MMNTKSGLILPKIDDLPKSDREITFNAIKSWQNQLPLSDLAACTKAYFLTLQDIYQAKIPTKLRYDILVLLRPTHSYLCQTLEKFYFSKELLSDDQKLIADLVYALRHEILNCYKLVIEENYNNSIFNRKILISALHNAMLCCMRIITHAYEQHRQPPKGMWHELNAIYKVIQNKGLGNKKVSKVKDWAFNLNTLNNLYAYILLYVVSNPHRLRRDEIKNLTYALEIWAPLLIIKHNGDSEECLFWVDLDSDSSPKVNTLDITQGPSTYFLDLSKINVHIEKLIKLKLTNNHEKMSKSFIEAEIVLPNHFLEELHQNWSESKERAHRREQTQGQIRACLGLTATSWYLQKSLQTLLMDDEDESDVIDLTDTNTILSSYNTEPPLYQCEIMDESSGGFRLKWLQEIPMQLECGEIIALQTSQDNNWLIGTIRWLRHEQDHLIYLGVQILAEHAIPLKARIAESTGNYDLPILLLPENQNISEPNKLVTPALPFKPGQELELTFQNKKYPAHLLGSTSLSPLYQEFEFEYLLQAISLPKTLTHPNSALTTN